MCASASSACNPCGGCASPGIESASSNVPCDDLASAPRHKLPTRRSHRGRYHPPALLGYLPPFRQPHRARPGAAMRVCARACAHLWMVSARGVARACVTAAGAQCKRGKGGVGGERGSGYGLGERETEHASEKSALRKRKGTCPSRAAILESDSDASENRGREVKDSPPGGSMWLAGAARGGDDHDHDCGCLRRVTSSIRVLRTRWFNSPVGHAVISCVRQGVWAGALVCACGCGGGCQRV